MKLKIERKYLKEEYTIGKLSINNVYFCDTLEDKVRNLPKEPKVYGQTAIPYGTYEIKMMYSPKFKKNMPYLLNVPYFQGIMIHSGNSAQDSLGCVLVGKNKVKGKVIESKATFDKLYIRINETIQNNEKVTIEIV